MEKYVFYDLETTGISSAYDQPLQFAAIVTDHELNEIERVDIRCQISPHILPAPMALYVTGLRPSQLVNDNLPNAFEFAQTIQSFTEKWSPAIWVGYNSIKFDEEVMRQMFYQNLQPNIFATQFFGNTRLDVMKMVFAIFDQQQNVFSWPTNAKGNISFKLDQLAPKNGFEAHKAHDALGDVEATIFLLNIIKTKAPILYSHFVKARDKEHNKQLLTSYKPMEVTLRFGGSPPKTYVGCFCGFQRNNNNSAGFFDLNQPNPIETISGSKSVIELALSGTPQKIRTLAINKADTIRPASASSTEWDKICSQIEQAEDFKQCVSECLAERHETKGDTKKLIEEKIFEGFYSYEDKALLNKFQSETWQNRAEILLSMNDDRLIQLGNRLIAFYAPEYLTENQKEARDSYIYKKWASTDEKPKWTTITAVKKQLEALRDKGCDPFLLEEFRAFYQTRLSGIKYSQDF